MIKIAIAIVIAIVIAIGFALRPLTPKQRDEMQLELLDILVDHDGHLQFVDPATSDLVFDKEMLDEMLYQHEEDRRRRQYRWN